MQNSANKLSTKGFAVFPCEVNGKRPLIKDWQNQATTNAEQIQKWWTQWPKANVGIHCENLLVLDVDPKNGGHVPPGIDPTYAVRTPSGGYHLYYHKPDGVKNSSGKVGEGLDIRSNRGYVIGPGSSIDGRPYKVIKDCVMSPAPGWLVEKAGEAVEIIRGTDNFDEDQDAATERARDRLKLEGPAIQGQGGDAHTYNAVCIVRDLGVSPESALEAMLDWNETCEPAWEADDLIVKINNAYSYARSEAGTRMVAKADEFEALEALPEPYPKESRSLLRTISDVDLAAVVKSSYLVKGWLPRQSNALMFGEWSGGKTFAALDMAAHVAAGEEWFGMRVRAGGVLYVGYEGARGMDQRMAALQKEHDFDWQGMEFAWYMINRDMRKDGQGRKDMAAVMTEFQQRFGRCPDLVVIDPMRDALGGSDSDAELTTPFMEYTREIGTRLDASVLTVHHPGHGAKDRARGDSGIEASMDTVIRVDKEASTIETLKQREGKLQRFDYRLKMVPLGTDDDGDPVASCVFDMLEVTVDVDLGDLA